MDRSFPWCSASFEVELKAMSPEIVQDMIEENRLVSQYSCVDGRHGVPLPGERTTLSHADESCQVPRPGNPEGGLSEVLGKTPEGSQ